MPERRLSIPGPAEYRREMILAFLDGSKTQVRLPVKPPPPIGADLWSDICMLGSGKWRDNSVCPCVEYRCPLGAPGHVLWVPETWATRYCTLEEDGIQGDVPFYQADYEGDPTEVAWRPWTTMPRRASRITRQLVDVRVERVQEISYGDAEAEGTPYDPQTQGYIGKHSHRQTAVAAFRDSWDARYAGTPFVWSENPWVWVGTVEIAR